MTKWADLDAPFDDPRWDDIASVARRDLRGMLDRTAERGRAEATAAAEQRLPRYEALFAAVDALMYKGLEERGPHGYPAHAGGDRDGHNMLIPLRYGDGAPTHLWENLRAAHAALSEPTEAGEPA